MKTRFIFNPHSGFNLRNPALIQRVHAFIAEHKLEATVVSTQAPKHATTLAREAIAEGCVRVVAIGGDGTMNEVATALVGTEVIFGLIPCGSGNGLGRHLGIHGLDRAFRALLHGEVRLIDTGYANGLPFFNVMGAGFDADIAHRFSRLEHRGFRAYVKTTLAAFSGYAPSRCTIRSGETQITATAFILSVANSDQFGNNCYIAPGARVDDGQVDLTIIPPVSLWRALPIAVRLFLKRIATARGVHCVRGAHFVIEREKPGLMHVDGEPCETTAAIEITVQPRSLRVLTAAAPRGKA